MKKAMVELTLQDIGILEIALEHINAGDSIPYTELDTIQQKIAMARANIKAQKNDY